MTPALNITCKEFHELWNANPDLVLIDCREQDEYDLVHIKGAHLLPMSQITERVNEIEHLKNIHFVVQCHHGGRSLRVVNWLRQQGFDQATNLVGGIDQWSIEIDPSLPRY